MNDTVRAVKSLEIPDVKVYEASGKELTVFTKGTLEVYYVADYDRFFLKINSFQYALSTQLPVLVSLIETRACRSYMVPSISGHYLLKLKTTPPAAVFQNFETILSNYARLSYRSGDEKLLAAQAKCDKVYLNQAGQIDKENRPVNSKYIKAENVAKAGGYIQKGGEVLKQNIIKAAYYIGKNMQQTTSENAFIAKPIQELKGLQHNAQFVDFSGTVVSKLIANSNSIEHAEQVRYNNPQGMIPNRPLVQQGTAWTELKETTANSAKSLWSGMAEAGTILSNAIENRRKNNNSNKNKKPVTVNKYSDVPEDVTKQLSEVTVGDKTVTYAPVCTGQPANVQPNHPINVQPSVPYQNYDDSHDDNLFVDNPTNQQLIHGVNGSTKYPYIEPAPGYNPYNYQPQQNFNNNIQQAGGQATHH